MLLLGQSRLSIQLLISAQVLMSGSWVQAPHWVHTEREDYSKKKFTSLLFYVLPTRISSPWTGYCLLFTACIASASYSALALSVILITSPWFICTLRICWLGEWRFYQWMKDITWLCVCVAVLTVNRWNRLLFAISQSISLKSHVRNFSLLQS